MATTDSIHGCWSQKNTPMLRSSILGSLVNFCEQRGRLWSKSSQQCTSLTSRSFFPCCISVFVLDIWNSVREAIQVLLGFRFCDLFRSCPKLIVRCSCQAWPMRSQKFVDLRGWSSPQDFATWPVLLREGDRSGQLQYLQNSDGKCEE